MTREVGDPKRRSEVEDLRSRLATAEYTLRAIGAGAADALVIADETGESLYLLSSGDRAYRQFAEVAKWGTATLTPDGLIVSCDTGLARALRLPVDAVVGTYMQAHVSVEDQDSLQEILVRPDAEHSVGTISLLTSEGMSLPVFVAATALQGEAALGSLCLVFTDVAEVESLERAANVPRRIAAARIRLLERAAELSLDELVERTIDEAEVLSDSRIGFYDFVAPDEAEVMTQNWSTRTKAEYCTADSLAASHRPESAGVWSESIKTHAPAVHNDYASLPGREGLPEGHAPLVRELIVPVIRGDKVRALLGVGNKPVDYDEEDVETISSFADLTWHIIESRITSVALRESEERYRLLFENMNEGVLFRTADGRLAGNPAAERLLGLAPGEIESMPAASLEWRAVHEDGSEFPASERPEMVALRTGLPVLDVIMGLHIPSLDELRWLRVSAMPVFAAEDPTAREAFVTFSDFTELKQSNQDLRRSNELLAGLTDATTHLLSHPALEDRDVEAALRAIAVASDADGAYICASRGLGSGTERAVKQPFVWHRPNGGVARAPSDSELEGAFDCWRDSFLAGAAVNVRAGDLPEPLRDEFEDRGVAAVLAVPIFSEGKLWGYASLEKAGSTSPWGSDVVEMVRTATSRMGSSIQMGNRALRDPLTGLYNRRYLEEALGQALARSTREESPLGLIMFDIDDFKRINDSRGHDAGDTVLREVAQRLRRRSRAEDTAARLGGDEFVVVMPCATLDSALVSAERWRSFVEQDSPSWGPEGSLAVTVSVGACSTATARTARELITQADKALFEAKNAGRNRVQGFLQPVDQST